MHLTCGLGRAWPVHQGHRNCRALAGYNHNYAIYIYGSTIKLWLEAKSVASHACCQKCRVVLPQAGAEDSPQAVHVLLVILQAVRAFRQHPGLAAPLC
jgi:hypothetical protein